MCTEPLSDYFAFGGHHPEFEFTCTALWRGYVGTWEITNDRLYIVGLTGTLKDGSEATLETLFPGYPDRVFAHWYSGTLRIPEGKQLEYVHMGYASTYERDRILKIEKGVVIGAHPGYPDREGFGRRIIPMSMAEIERMVAAQIGALMGVAALAGAKVRYVKAHGALGNFAADDRGVADAVARATKAVDPSLALLAISGTEIEPAGRDAGLTVVSEIFADRAYLANGRLMPRSRPGSVLHDPHAIAYRMVEVVLSGLMPS